MQLCSRAAVAATWISTTCARIKCRACNGGASEQTKEENDDTVCEADAINLYFPLNSTCNLPGQVSAGCGWCCCCGGAATISHHARLHLMIVVPMWCSFPSEWNWIHVCLGTEVTRKYNSWVILLLQPRVFYYKRLAGNLHIKAAATEISEWKSRGKYQGVG